jgi:geranylgeranyl pyrophosphate synthase
VLTEGPQAARIAEIERRLKQELAATCDVDGSAPPSRLREAMAHILLAGGKRLRPLLVLESARAAAGALDDDEALRGAWPAALAVEYIHTYSLIHDDLPALDDDDLRRGQPTIHVLYDEATAILAGDSLLTDAFALVAAAPRRAADQCLELSRAAGSAGMVGGQWEDMAAEGKVIDAAALEDIHRRKTGRLFVAACALGGLGVDAGDDVVAALRSYGAAFGLAFQIFDDVLDVTGQEDTRGKRAGGDAEANKATYVRAYGLEGARSRAATAADEAIAALAPLGEDARTLERLARFAVDRDR